MDGIEGYYAKWESQGQGSLVGCRLWGLTESDTTEAIYQQQQYAKWNKTEKDKYCIISLIVMTNLDSILKSRDITLLTKVHLVKAMVFPVVVYGCES